MNSFYKINYLANTYSNTPHYFNYTLNSEFTDSNYVGSNTSGGFFPPSLQLPYTLNYNGAPTPETSNLQTLTSVTNRHHEEAEESVSV